MHYSALYPPVRMGESSTTFQCTTVHCIPLLQCTAVHCIPPLQCTTVHCTTVHCIPPVRMGAAPWRPVSYPLQECSPSTSVFSKNRFRINRENFSLKIFTFEQITNSAKYIAAFYSLQHSFWKKKGENDFQKNPLLTIFLESNCTAAVLHYYWGYANFFQTLQDLWL